jgi:CO dehydrogenase/acetyl-CoA synthase beta subunit
MELYDKYIEELRRLLEPFEPEELPVDSGSLWPDSGSRNMILKSEMAYELGGGDRPAVSAIAYTDKISTDRVLLCGPDLDCIDEDQPYARIALANVDTGEMKSKESIQEVYTGLRKIEYEKYHINPKGYMMRISTSGNREPVRIGRRELEDGLSFAGVGSLFLRAYKSHSHVQAAQVIFITRKDFPYGRLAELAGKMESVTGSLNYIFNNLQMDCSTCGMKPVCDEVDGLRQLHMGEQKNI